MKNIRLRMHIFLYASIANLIKTIVEVIKIERNSDYQTGIIGVLFFLTLSIVCFIIFLDAKKKINVLQDQLE